MNDFTASNGVVIRRHETIVGIRRSVEDTEPVRVPGYAQPERVQTYLDPRQWDAIAEAVQAAADERLGRWRWPENPDYVVQPFAGGSGWNALCESTCVSGTFLSRDAVINSPSYLAPAVLAYIDAHPEPKPWDAAQEGDIWALTGAGGLEQPWRRHEGKWISCTPSLRTYDAAHAIAGRCIWSEASNGD